MKFCTVVVSMWRPSWVPLSPSPCVKSCFVNSGTSVRFIKGLVLFLFFAAERWSRQRIRFVIKESCDDVPQESAGYISQLPPLWMLCSTFSPIIKIMSGIQTRTCSLFYNFKKQRVYFLSCVCFVYTKLGETSKGHTGWVSDPGENSLH